MPACAPGELEASPHRRLLARASLAALLAVVATLVLLPPEHAAFYPRCPFYAAFGLLCPGCGATRALSALLRGHLLDALRWNPLVVVLIPAAALYAGRSYAAALRGRATDLPGLRPAAVAGLVVLAAAFTVFRNLPR